MSDRLVTQSPVDGSTYVERPFASESEVQRALDAAVRAQQTWRRVPLKDRAAIVSKAIDAFVARRTELAQEISWQMGRPISQSPGEIGGFEDRARYMISIAEESLKDVDPGPKPGFNRFIRREPLGVVLVIAPWNYPYLTAVNAVVPALLAGNTVILRHSHQTPLCAERMVEAFREAGLPPGVFQYLHTNDVDTSRLVGTNGIDYVAFTGSVRVGHLVQQAAAARFVHLGLELGGKDPAYVRSDAKLEHAVENLVDGAYFNSGQSCCGIERIYVHQDVYEDFVEGFVELTKKYRLGNPLDPNVNLGPVVRTSAADLVRSHVHDAVAAGARALIAPGAFAAEAAGTPYLGPQVLVDVTQAMRVMREESFGPVVGIAKVSNDDEAILFMNDSAFGLTAAVWTQDEGAALRIGDRLDTGTVFMNRCDYLDPALAWTGVKDSGRGASLSRIGYEVLTRPKSYHLRAI
jgi:acyl-CoA reductase-like NAD-dependent aldehyde dehydrogenase